ncbi:MAG: HEAT repeat domain-containing protein [Chloroflexota bacterium]|nr:HEAT repeat domain-containing protein [Chloroflexota bacterium]
MAHAKSNVRSHPAIHWQTTRNPRQVFWDVILLLGIALLLAFLSTRVDSALLSRVAGILTQSRPVTQDEPVLQPVDWASVADLVSALKDPNPSVRVSAAEALGSKHALAATDALLAATYDSNTQVREEAAAALGDLGAIQALPRLEELQILSGNTYIEIAAFEAEGKITKEVGAAIGVPRSSVQALTVAQNGTAYAAALNEFYALNDGEWQHVGQLPASPNDLSAGPDGRLIFMSTVSAGLYRSQDGGKTWEHLQYGLQTPTQLKTTAVVVNLKNVDQIYVALAVNGSTSDLLNPLGIVSSNDGGKTWLMLPDSPNSSVTSALIIDRTNYRFLYGMSDVGPWGYQLPADAN